MSTKKVHPAWQWKSEFVDGLVDYLRKDKDVPELPRSQRHVSRPGLEKLFTKIYFKSERLETGES
jgi:hypothetical protein